MDQTDLTFLLFDFNTFLFFLNQAYSVVFWLTVNL